jgi:hypothetical protein
VFERDNWGCQSCGDDTQTLCVHHLYYLPSKEPWEYPLKALITLCEDCHESETEIKQDVDNTLLFAFHSHFLNSYIHQIACGIGLMKLQHTSEVVATMLEWALQNPNIQQEFIDRYFEYLTTRHHKYEKKITEKELANATGADCVKADMSK